MVDKVKLAVQVLDLFENLKEEDSAKKITALVELITKHQEESEEKKMDYRDLLTIIDGAKITFSSKVFPVYLGDTKKRVPEQEQANLVVIESTIRYLNKIGCLSKIPKFDYKDNVF